MAACLTLALGQGALPQTGEADRTPVAQAAPPEIAPSILFNATAPEAERAASAAQAVAGQRDDWLAAALEQSADAVAARLVIDALIASRNGTNWTDGALRVLGAAAGHAPDDATERALGALAEQRSRPAVRAALSVYTSDRAAAVRTLAYRTLVRQTGMSSLGDNPDAWRAWWAEVEWLPEPEWRGRLATGQSARALRLEQQRDSLAARLVETHRRLHAALPPDQRATLMAELIADERVELRLLGLDLAQRSMLNARSLTDAALAAAIERMRDNDERVRAQAALIVARAAPPNAGEAAGDALAAESSPVAAAAQMAILTRFPAAGGAAPSLRWLGAGPPAGPAAADALAAMARIGMLDDISTRAQARALARAIDAGTWTAAHVRLLDAIGEQADLARLAAEGLTSDTVEVRLAAATALARRPGWDAPLADALRTDHSLLAPISQSIATRLASAQGLVALRDIAQSAGVVEGLPEHEDAMIAMLPPSEALQVLGAIEPPARRLRLLDALAARPDAADAALLALARERLLQGDGPGALSATDRLRDPSATGARTVLVLVLAWANDLDRATSVNASAEAWVAACVQVEEAGLAHAPAVAARALELHAATLSEQDRQRLQTVAGTAEEAAAERSEASATKSSDASGGS